MTDLGLIYNRSMAWSGALLFVILKILFKENHNFLILTTI